MKKNLKYWIIPLVGVCLLILGLAISCSSQKKETTTTPQNNAQNLNENQVLKFEPGKDEANSYGSDSANNDGYNNRSFDVMADETVDIPDDLLAEIRQALLKERYPQVIEMLEGRTEDAATYYRGIAYFVMMLEDKKYSPAERAEFGNYAEQYLEDVANNSTYDSLKTRGLLWYAVTLQVRYAEYQPLKKAVGSLYEIRKYPNSRVYNDSIYYMGNIHAKMGWYGPARNYYKKVADLNQGDDRIYDYTDKTFYNTYEASEVGLQRLADYMSGQHPDYGPTDNFNSEDYQSAEGSN